LGTFLLCMLSNLADRHERQAKWPVAQL